MEFHEFLFVYFMGGVSALIAWGVARLVVPGETHLPSTERWDGISTVEQRRPFEQERNREMRATLEAIAALPSPERKG